MARPIVYQGIQSGHPTADGLFAGLKFWFSNTVPQRSRFIEDVKSNGGEVVILEKQADVCLYDHARKNPPPGVYSYRFVEYSIRNGQLEDPEAHRIGGLDTRAARPVGSWTLASKGSRKPFTEADDQMLWNWVKPLEGTRGAAGNVLYQQLEDANPRHTYQSWRDRWLKYVQFQNRCLTSNNEEGQPDETPAAEPPATATITSRVQNARSSGAVSSPGIAVEVPMNSTPQRRRGRPPKRQFEMPVDGSPKGKVGRPTKRQPIESKEDTMDVGNPKVVKQAPMPTRSAQKEDIGEPKPQGNSRPKKDSNTGSWEFSNEETKLLLNATETILSVPETDVGRAWEKMAENYQSHTAPQWRNYFEEVVVPFYRNQQKEREQSKNLNITQEERSGNANNGADSSKKKRGERHATHLRQEQAEQNGDEVTPYMKQKAEQHRRSPSFQSQSPTSWKSENEGHRPGPNESRKRSPAKSNSQESATSKNLDGTAEKGKGVSQPTRLGRHTTEDVEDVHSRPTKRRKLSAGKIAVLEIPSTPEHTQETETLQELPGTPTPRARKSSFSPLFEPLNSADEEEDLPFTPEKEIIDPETRTSPISVHLVSDNNPAIASSPSVLNGNAQMESSGSPTPEFEIAPDFSQIGQDAEEEEEEEEEEPEEFETAAETPQAPKADTQALFAAPTQNAEGSLDFGLPDPEGGWDALDADPIRKEEEAEAEEPTSPDSQTSSTASTLGLDLDAWISQRAREGRDQDLLIAAAEATNMHMKLADVVYASLERGNGIPRDLKGVWTEEDDELLMGTDARGVKRVLEKHGQRSMDERFECLEVWNA
jgi:TRF2-interacting telomeric protein/Rap1 - C terminal domain/Rap1 Myb domain/BRCT domain, a BRCA1 C-terminus domain